MQEAEEKWKRSFVLDPTSAPVGGKLTSREIDLDPLRKQAEELESAREAMGTEPESAAPALSPEATMIAESPDAENGKEPAEDTDDFHSLPKIEVPESLEMMPAEPVDSPDISIREPVEVP